MTRLEYLTQLRLGIDYPNVDTKKHRESVRDFLVLLIDEEIERERLLNSQSDELAERVNQQDQADLSQVNRPKGSEPTPPLGVTTAQPPETKS